MATDITVRGSFSVFQPPERVTVHAAVAYEGPEMAPVYQQVARDLETVTGSVQPLLDGPITRWTAQQLQTSSTRPWNHDGVQLPLVHRASVSVEAEFGDFTEMSAWAGANIAAVEGFRVSQVIWSLTGARRDELRRDARRRAVQDAADRAQQYADALDLGVIRPVALADAGMLGVNPDHVAGHQYLRAAATGPGGAPDVEFVPQDIEVSAAVDARFAAGGI